MLGLRGLRTASFDASLEAARLWVFSLPTSSLDWLVDGVVRGVMRWVTLREKNWSTDYRKEGKVMSGVSVWTDRRVEETWTYAS